MSTPLFFLLPRTVYGSSSLIMADILSPSWWYTLVFLYFVRFGQSSCYYPNGTEASGFIPIDGNAEVSACCSPYDLFTNIGLCKSPYDGGNNWYWRNTCTDQSWKSSSCPQYCVDTGVDPRYANSDWPLIACSETTFCCAYNAGDVESTDEACCSDESRILDIGPAKRVGGKIESTSLFPATATTTVFAISSTTSSTSSTSSTSTSASSIASTTTPATAAAATNSSKNMSSPTSSPTPGLSTGAKAGIGVGVAVGAIALIGIGAFFLLRRRRRGRSPLGQPPPPAQEYYGPAEGSGGPPHPADIKQLPLAHSNGVYTSDEDSREKTGVYYSPYGNSPSAGGGNGGHASELDTQRPPAEIPAGDVTHNRGELPA